MEQTSPQSPPVDARQPAADKPRMCEERQELLCQFSEIIVSYLAEFDLTEKSRQDAHACYLGISALLKGEE